MKIPRAISAGAKFSVREYNNSTSPRWEGSFKNIQTENPSLYNCVIYLRADLIHRGASIRSSGSLAHGSRYEVERLQAMGLTWQEALRLGALSVARFLAEPLAWNAMVVWTRPYCEAAEFIERWLRVEDDGSETWFDDGTQVLFRIPALRVHTFRDGDGVLVDQTITRNIEDCVGPATVYTCVRPRGEGWEVYDDRKDRITIWRRPAVEGDR